ncbi:hypothetical protein jhhlp_002882 [Lomentospora prolificans]|uniref:Uncharacterized protein n=1 Tax=Lomentospora prolificans TaxID=41688 RepID=A0A2N3NFD9_9PEZI|nr:hypothetical protein jhhlp_002882 [Lomentospora prolificans]
MFANPVVRSARPSVVRAAGRARTSKPRQIRFQSSTASSGTKNGNSHFASGVAGGVAAGAVLYGVYLLTPAGRMQRAINKGAREATLKYQEATKKLQQTTADGDQAIAYIKEYCFSYLGWIPGARPLIDSAFQDIDELRKNHGDEVNHIVSDAYKQFQTLSKGGFTMETASEAIKILTDVSKKLSDLAGDAFADILDNHPQAKEKLGGSVDQLKKMGAEYGPEAKEQVDKTFKQVKEIMGGGFSAANLDKARKIIEEKVEAVRKLGDESWKKALEQAKPYLDKNQKVKSLIEDNAEALKQGNAKELFEKAKSAIESGNLGNLEEYVNKALEKAKNKGSKLSEGLGLDEYFNMLPSGGEVLSKVSQLKEVAEKHKDEGEKLLQETMDEIKQVLEKKSEKAKEIAEKAKKEAK